LDGSKPSVDFAGHANAVFGMAFSSEAKSLLPGGSNGVLSDWEIKQDIQSHCWFGRQNRIASKVVDPKSTRGITASAE
jgi:hypothetical protein